MALGVAVASGLDGLEAATRAFFALHWSTDRLGPAPTWDRWATFLQGSVPNHEQGGCYALFSEAGLSYIGLGASRGGGLYPNHGISRRLMAHVLRSNRSVGPTFSRLLPAWEGTTSLYTLGMGKAEYLAPALESYLIRELSPPKNSRV